MRILVTGASGLVGRRLVPILLKAGHAVVATSRDPESLKALRFPAGILPLGWDGRSQLQVPGRVDAIVHLAGESIVARRWTAESKQRMRDSLLESTRRLVEFIARRRPAERPTVFVCANAVGYYGLDPGREVREDDPAGDDFMATVCRDWEAEARKAPAPCRAVVLRIGHVLSRDGGYLAKLLPFTRLGLGGPMGGGKQPMPWIHIDDLCGIILWAITHGHVEGAYNTVAPDRLTQRRFVQELRRVLPFPSLPSVVPIPKAALRLRFGGVAEAMLGGQDADPAKLLEAGYPFGYSELEDALADLVRRKPIRAPTTRQPARTTADP